MFTELDASAAVADKAVLPMKLTGRSGEIVRDLYSGWVLVAYSPRKLQDSTSFLVHP